MNDTVPSLLLVDDDADVVWGIGRCLARAGFSVTTSGNGAEAINLLASRHFDFLLTDIRMPEVNGIELTGWTRKNRPQTRVMVMTAFGSPAIRQLSFRKGAIQYLEKPLDPNLLIEVLRSQGQKELFSGSIDEIDLLDYMQLMMLSGKQAIVEVVCSNGDRGLVFIASGSVLHAKCGELKGEDALYRCLSFSGGTFANLPWVEPEEITIHKPGDFLLVEAARKRDETNNEVERDSDRYR
ncbi:MAG: response regulator [Desulfomonile tiedjei]|uniref:Response regulator n=1 Tax=Desulfomonile tiedjei TaxID=2358 RepID=A0A9D6V1J1_9BACT|nr:response regulator [Desulfomonile tiedjei]